MATSRPGGPSELGPGASLPATARLHRRLVLGSAARVLVVTATLGAAYLTVPETASGRSVTVRLAVSLVAVLVVLGWQIRAVSRSRHPVLRGVESVAVVIPLLVVSYATSYLTTSVDAPDSFSERLSRLDALYFSVTVLTTTGFGDITARSELARVLVTSQLVVDLALGGLVAKVLVGAVRRRREALVEEGTMPPPDARGILPGG